MCLKAPAGNPGYILRKQTSHFLLTWGQVFSDPGFWIFYSIFFFVWLSNFSHTGWFTKIRWKAQLEFPEFSINLHNWLGSYQRFQKVSEFLRHPPLLIKTTCLSIFYVVGFLQKICACVHICVYSIIIWTSIQLIHLHKQTLNQ